MKHISINIFLMTVLALFNLAHAQDKVTGTVKDANGDATLEGVVVNLIGSQGVSTFTDRNGFYELPISSKNEVALEFAFADYQTKRVYIHGRSTVNVSMIGETASNREAFVKTPFGEKLRRDISGSSVTLTKEQIQRRGYQTIESALQGMVPGLLVTSRSGVSAGGGTMSVRGASAITTNSQPLVVVDGVIYETRFGDQTAIEGYSYNPLVSISVRDIEQVTVVKDGTASLYGSLGGNGVIYIYTSESNVKKTKVDFSASFGVSMAPERERVLDASSFQSYALEQTISRGFSYDKIEEVYPFLVNRAEGVEKYRYGQDTDWQDEVFQTGMLSRYSANIQGGDEITTYNFSVGYANNEDVVKNTDFESFDILMNARMRLLSNLTVRPTVALTKINSNLRPQGPNETISPTSAALFKSPLMGVNQRSEKGVALPFFDEYGAFGMSNPAALVESGEGVHENFRLRAGVQSDLEITGALGASVVLMTDLMNTKESSFVPSVGGVPQLGGGARSLMQNAQKSFFSILSDANLHYKDLFSEKHRITATAGVRVKISDLKDELATDVNSASDKFTVVGRGDGSYRKLAPVNGKWNMLSLYGNAGYAYLDKYYLDFGLSVDGSSKFSTENRYAYFPSVSGAWRVSSESFMRGLTFVDDFKIRASYGYTGNEDIGYYSSRFYYVGLPYFNISGLERGGIPSTDLKWEVSKQLNVGLDLALFDNRVKATVDVYQTRTNDLLTVERLDKYYGTDLLLSNAGSVENKGVEVGLNVEVLRTKDMYLDLGATLATNRNEVVELGKNAIYDNRNGSHLITEIQGGEIITQVGESVNGFFGYKSNGVIKTTQEAEALGLRDRYGNAFGPGDIAFADLNNDKIIDESDRMRLGSSMPDLFGSFSANFRYKKLTVGLLVDYVYGNEVFNQQRQGLESMTNYYNQSESVNRRWRSEGQETDIPKATYGDPMGNGRFSDRWIEDGSFIRLKNVTVSYDFDVRNKVFRNLSAYVTANNLVTFSDYLGASPDVSYGNMLMMRGVDYGQYPPLRSFLVGVKLGI
ncbi:SusC/RagA family TonB-linked outer membrane protein [Fulvitalea axinellae]|uniref:SusC/RagA family TonB-linked outer membrane protein n=1 Tax=Fulvitalea axinellae TaxID=1182444 RepID=A0AAU9CLR6_9BACT|nr:SusC/RagA family TonB-linked outer membrane protein [Fulvitalea axinellae]